MFLIRLDRPTTDLSLGIIKRDAILEGADGPTIKWLFDLASKYSYPSQAAPANGALVANMDESGNNGSVIIRPGEVAAYAGHGIDWTGTTKVGNRIEGPAAPLADIWGDGVVNQYFGVCLWIRFPTQADFVSDVNLHTLFTCAPAGASYATQPELVYIALQTGGSLSFRRQTALNTVVAQAINVSHANYWGRVAQIGFWRDATGPNCRVRTSAITTNLVGAVGPNNALNFSAMTPKIGPGPFNGAVDLAFNANHLQLARWRVYRSWIKNLRAATKTMAAELDDDWNRITARGDFT